MIIALTTTIVGTFNVLTGVTKAPCPIKCRCGICAFSWSSLGPTASFRAPSVWSPLWPVTVHWIRFCERKRLKPKYQASLAGLGERRFEIWDLRLEIWVEIWDWRFEVGGGGLGGGREQSCFSLALFPFCISLRPKPNSLRLTRVKFVYSWFNKVCSGKLLFGGSLNQIIALFHMPNAQLPRTNLLPKQPFLI